MPLISLADRTNQTPALLPPSKITSPTFKPLWHTTLPPPHLHASVYQTGYWTPSRPYDTIPMSFILFSPSGSYDQLSHLTGIASDPHMRCWGVSYTDNEGKRTGPQDKMEEVKTFKIEGQAGETVTKVEIGMNSLVQGVKVFSMTQIAVLLAMLTKNQAHHKQKPSRIFRAHAEELSYRISRIYQRLYCWVVY